MKVFVDRIESYTAVIETEDRKYLHVPLSVLPDGIKEGSVLVYENGEYLKAAQEESLRRRRLFALQEKLRRKNRG